MFLTRLPHFSPFSPFRVSDKNSPTAVRYDALSRTFDDAILHRLKVLDLPASGPIGLSWFSLAFDFLSFAHTEARTLVSGLQLPPDSDDTLSGYLDGSLKLLDLCNSISSLIERLRLRRLSLRFALQLLDPTDSGFPAPEKLRRARDSLSDWEKPSFGPNKRGFQSNPQDLIRDLALGLGDAPRGKISSAEKLVRRTIQAVGLLTVFFAGALVSALTGSAEIATVRVPAEFSWADSFNKIEAVLSAESTQRFLLEDVAARARVVRDAIDDLSGSDEDKRTDRLNAAVGDLTNVTELFSEGLDRLSNGVNGMFHTVLSSRSGILDNVREATSKMMPEAKSIAQTCLLFGK